MNKKKPLSVINLEEKYGFSFVKAAIFNLLAFSTTIGLTNHPKVDSVFGFVMTLLLYTLLEVMVLNLMKRYLMAWIIKTLGLILIVVYIVLIYVAISIVPDVRFMTVTGFIIFIVLFLLIRVMMMYYYEKFKERRKRR